MIYVLIGMSLLFMAIPYGVTENNARYLLAGYNTMTEKERDRFDLKRYLVFLRRFHLFLGLSLLVIGLVLHFSFGEPASGIFLSLYPLGAYIYFIWRSIGYAQGGAAATSMVAIFVLAGTLILVGVLTFHGHKENELLIRPEAIEFTGMYGEKMAAAEIKSIQLQAQGPAITAKNNGFALGNIKKGFFGTRQGKVIKLILNTDKKPYLLFTKQDGSEIYYAPKKSSPQALFARLKKTFPGRVLE